MLATRGQPMSALKTTDDGAVRSLMLCRAREMNTITQDLRRDLADAISDAEADAAIKVLLLRAEGPAFCAGFSLDIGIAHQARENSDRVWDSASDLQMISTYANTWARLHE